VVSQTPQSLFHGFLNQIDALCLESQIVKRLGSIKSQAFGNVGVGRALLTVDEMSLGLAPVVVDQLLGVLGEIRKQGITVLLVEQDVFAAFSVADRGYVMETGRIVREGAISELENDPEVRKAYLGVQ